MVAHTDLKELQDYKDGVKIVVYYQMQKKTPGTGKVRLLRLADRAGAREYILV